MPSSAHHADHGSVSVVIPTRNRADLLEQTLRSLAGQSLTISEIIVVDDGSTDATANLLHDWDVTSIRNSEGRPWGAARARNVGLERVTTEYVAFVDSDDLLPPGALYALRSALDAHPRAPFAFGRGLAAIRDHQGWHPRGLISPDESDVADLTSSIFVRNSVPSSGALVRTSAARQVGGYDVGIDFVEDHDLWVRLAQLGQPIHVEELTCIHRRHASNRHSPVLAAPDSAMFMRLGEIYPRLSPRLPERLGVELCEVCISAANSRQAGLLWHAARDLLFGRPAKVRIIRSFGRRFRGRRQSGREGRLLWENRPDITRWLSSY